MGRMARRAWTSEQRAAQSAAIRRWRPWAKSSGPTSDIGKAVASQNAVKHGLRGREWTEMRKRMNDMLRACRDRMKQI
jgi:hypothetical protein